MRTEIELPAPTSRIGVRARLEDPEAVGDYLADMIAQLECIARATNKDMLAYLLAMASIQAATPEARWDRSISLH